jgi:hypothetical protein
MPKPLKIGHAWASTFVWLEYNFDRKYQGDKSMVRLRMRRIGAKGQPSYRLSQR